MKETTNLSKEPSAKVNEPDPQPTQTNSHEIIKECEMLLEEAEFSNQHISNSNYLKSLSPAVCKEFEKNFNSPCSYTNALKEKKAPESMGVTQMISLINRDDGKADELVDESSRKPFSESLFKCDSDDKVEVEDYFSAHSHDSFENVDVDLLQEQACKPVTILSVVTIQNQSKREDFALESDDDIFNADMDVIETTPDKKKPIDNL